MKIEIPDTTTLPEWMQPLVADGHLDLGAVPPPEDVSGLKSTVTNLRGQIEGWGKLAKHPDELAAKIADLTEKAKGTGKGAEDAQARLDAMEKKHAEENAAKDERISKLFQRNALSELKSELAKAGFITGAIDPVANSALSRIRYSEDGTPEVMMPDGTHMQGTGPLHGGTLADLAKDLSVTMSDLMRDTSLPGGGKPPGSNGGKPSSDTITRAQFDAMSHAERSAHSKSGGKLKD